MTSKDVSVQVTRPGTWCAVEEKTPPTVDITLLPDVIEYHYGYNMQGEIVEIPGPPNLILQEMLERIPYSYAQGSTTRTQEDMDYEREVSELQEKATDTRSIAYLCRFYDIKRRWMRARGISTGFDDPTQETVVLLTSSAFRDRK
jgi:hypothetical protein